MLYWHWWVLMGILLIIEIFTLTMFFLFFAISAFLLGVIMWFYPELPINWQLLLAGVFALGSMLLGYFFLKKRKQKNNVQLDVNDRLGRYIGRTVVITQRSHSGVAKARIGDTEWRVLVEDAKVGDSVEILDVQSTSFIARKV
ncbi:NfeD family protein [Cysteiniphilum sp. JM-1]|uniref:NfeD family protein n=1 Tax=Cysteiniphilum sp. JM-1 TaxID=2610891 RepID=UPI001248AC76|nr:NfeD family protein [Cysteiniphilum sp. JM-1]